MDTKIYQFSKAFVARFLYAAAVSKNHDVPQFVSPYLLNMTASNSKIKLCTEYKNARVRLSTIILTWFTLNVVFTYREIYRETFGLYSEIQLCTENLIKKVFFLN